MQRNINIIIDGKPVDINGFNNISINNIDSIVNFSVDILYCTVINFLPNEYIEQIIMALCAKIRQGGQMIIGLKDIKNICLSFANNSMDNDTFFSLISQTKNLFFLPEFEVMYEKHMSQSFDIIDTDIKNDMLMVSLQRK